MRLRDIRLDYVMIEQAFYRKGSGEQPLNFIQRTLRFFNHHFLRLSWFALIWVLVGHFLLSLLLFSLAGETVLLADWFYYYITTATTIGYGDLSPSTDSGKLMASLFVMPGAVVLFAGFLGKLSSLFIDIWRKGMQGKDDFSNLSDHIVILGWNKHDTSRMIELIFGDTRRIDRQVVLCATETMDNPFPEKIRFVQGKNLNSEDVLCRAGVASAARIIVFRGSDDETLATCLTLAASGTPAHIVAWFNEESMARLLKQHCPEIECHCSISVELLVRSAQDPGSYRLQGQLLSTLEGPTQYSVQVPDEFSGVRFGTLLEFLKDRHEAIALGIADSVSGNDLKLNPDSRERVEAGQLIYYMAAQRIRREEIEWNALGSK